VRFAGRSGATALSQTAALPGHRGMTNSPDRPDLVAIAAEAELEIEYAETVEVAVFADDEGSEVLATAELGYYEAELTSLREAATRLNEAEQPPE
jgi:hypothetical protein